MKISLRNISDLNFMYETGFDPYEYTVEEVIQRIGLQLGAIEGIEDYREWYDNAIVVRVVACEKHPNADKLSVCMIDDGGYIPGLERKNDETYSHGLVQVVCGAPNAKKDMWAVWLPPQSIVPASRRSSEPFVLESREIRGEMSNGMLASPKELDLTDEHEGILELQQDGLQKELQPGTLLNDYIPVADVVIDLENKMFTHRPDCFGELGVARELSGIFGQKFSSPGWYRTATIDNRFLNARTETLPVTVANEAGEKVPRFMIQSVADIEMSEETLTSRFRLRRSGLKPVNMIVDWTNYFMHMTGQPLHAYDYDKVKSLSGGNTPVVLTRMAKKGEKLQLINGKEIELHEDDIVIATDKNVIGLAGVMGGSETEVDDHTKNIILECGTFDMYAIRRTSMRHGLFTEAVTRFNKGQSPLQNDKVLAKITDWCAGFGRGTIASQTYDITNFDIHADNLNRVEVQLSFINSRLGTELEFSDVVKLLENVEFVVEYLDDDKEGNFLVTVPFWRMDIAIKEDIVEEVGRLYGFQKIPTSLPPRSSKPTPKNKLREYKSQIRNTLSRLGANEVLTYSFVHGDLLKGIGLDPEECAYHIRNALSPGLQYYRPSLLPSLMAKVPQNIRAQEGGDDNVFALFEIGKAHVKGHSDKHEPDIPAQFHRLALVFAADAKSSKGFKNDAYYSVKQFVDEITDGRADYIPLDTNKYPITAPFQLGRSAILEIDGKILGVVGEFRGDVKKKLKLPEYCAGFEIDCELLLNAEKEKPYIPLSQYPSVRQDVTFEVPSSCTWSQLETLLHAELQVIHAEDNVSYRINPGDIYQPENSDKRRITFHIEFTSYDKTLQTSEVNKTIEQIEKAAHESLNAVRI